MVVLVFECTMLPPLVEYYRGLTGPIIAAIGVGATLTIVTIGIFFGHLPAVLDNVPKQFKGKTVYLLGIYQVNKGFPWNIVSLMF